MKKVKIKFRANHIFGHGWESYVAIDPDAWHAHLREVRGLEKQNRELLACLAAGKDFKEHPKNWRKYKYFAKDGTPRTTIISNLKGRK